MLILGWVALKKNVEAFFKTLEALLKNVEAKYSKIQDDLSSKKIQEAP